MKTIIKQCEVCGISFEVRLSEVKRGNGRLCSRKCVGKKKANAPKKPPNVKCAYCEVEFYKAAYTRAQSKSGLYFCCREHKDAAQRIGGVEEIQPAHYGTGQRVDYRSKALREYGEQCQRCGYNLFPEVLQAHHKDRNRQNNALENLEVLCPTCHMEEHFLTRTGFWSRGCVV
jgi:hypothetical protein